jgi:GT2 family glycosyltransferase
MWLLNADTVVTPAALSALVSHCEEDRRIGMCGSTLVYNRDRTTVQAHGGARLSPWRAEGMQLGHGSVVSTPVDRDAIEAQMDYVAGASMLVSASFVRSIGLMEERYFLYFEELDWAVRAQGQFRLGFAPDSIVYHKEGGSIGTSATAGHSPFSLYYLSRNSLRFYRSYYPARLPVLAAYLVARALKFRLSGSKAHSFAIARALAGRPYRPTKP